MNPDEKKVSNSSSLLISISNICISEPGNAFIFQHERIVSMRFLQVFSEVTSSFVDLPAMFTDIAGLRTT